MSLYSNLVKVKKKSRKGLLEALALLCNFDCDFTGKNGIDYNWEETNDKEFTSNLEFLLNEVKEIPNDNEVVQAFIEEWMNRDSHYYSEYNYDTLTDSKGNVLAISLAVVTKC